MFDKSRRVGLNLVIWHLTFRSANYTHILFGLKMDKAHIW